MKKFLKIVPFIVLSVLIGVTVTYAGNLTAPVGAPSKTMKSFADLYALIHTGTNTPSTDFTTPSTVAPTMNSVGDIYDLMTTKIANIDPSKILIGTTIFGKAGTAGVNLSNMWNGTCNNTETCPLGTEVLGGSQAAGGVDDFNGNNLGGPIPTGRYAITWIVCNIGNNYCGTGDTGANAKDTSTDLIWSYPCHGEGCSAWDTSAPDLTNCLDGNCNYVNHTYDQDTNTFSYPNADSYYSWDNSGVPYPNSSGLLLNPEGDNPYDSGNNNMTAQQLCSNRGSGWSLPTQKQFLQAYIDGSYGKLEPQGVKRYYWSATTTSNNLFGRWTASLSDGSTGFGGQDNNTTNSIRCVQEDNNSSWY
jgi:hypothetical protein